MILQVVTNTDLANSIEKALNGNADNLISIAITVITGFIIRAIEKRQIKKNLKDKK